MYEIKYLCDVDDYLNHATDSEARKVVKNLKYLSEYGVRPEVRDLKKLKGYDFWEVRIKGKDNTRIFCIEKRGIVYVLHIFKKKTNKTSSRDLRIGKQQCKLIDNYIQKDIIYS